MLLCPVNSGVLKTDIANAPEKEERLREWIVVVLEGFCAVFRIFWHLLVQVPRESCLNAGSWSARSPVINDDLPT